MIDFNCYNVRVTPSMLGAGNVIRPDAILELVTSATDADMCVVSHGVTEMLEEHLAWVITTAYAEIYRPITACTQLIAKTHPVGRRGPFVCRETILTDGENDYLKTLISSVLFNTENRKVQYIIPDFLKISELDPKMFPPKRKLDCEFSSYDNRSINNSDLDCIGHVNNGRYAAFVYDMLSDDKLSKMNQMCGFLINFKHELKKENTLHLEKSETCSQFFARGSTGNEVSFEAIFDFR